MKHTFVFFLMLVLSAGHVLLAQPGNKALPAVNVEDLQGAIVNAASLDNGGKPMVISFWATWCKPCIKELDNIGEVYDDWQAETGVKVVAVSIDDARNASLVNPFVHAKGWEYEMYLDKNSDLKRAMNVVNIPHTFLLDGNREVVYQHTSYAEGDEQELYRRILSTGASGAKANATGEPVQMEIAVPSLPVGPDTPEPGMAGALVRAKDETIRAQQEALDAKSETIRALQSENKTLREMIELLKADR